MPFCLHFPFVLELSLLLKYLIKLSFSLIQDFSWLVIKIAILHGVSYAKRFSRFVAATSHDFNVYMMSECDIKTLCCLSSLYSKVIQAECVLSFVEHVLKLLECYFRVFQLISAYWRR